VLVTVEVRAGLPQLEKESVQRYTDMKSFLLTSPLQIDGRGAWAWSMRIFPRGARAAVDGAGQSGWLTLTTFVRVQIFVAAGDAVGIGLVAFFLGLPLVIPLAVICCANEQPSNSWPGFWVTRYGSRQQVCFYGCLPLLVAYRI
jgi:hypothetical protein